MSTTFLPFFCFFFLSIGLSLRIAHDQPVPLGIITAKAAGRHNGDLGALPQLQDLALQLLRELKILAMGNDDPAAAEPSFFHILHQYCCLMRRSSHKI